MKDIFSVLNEVENNDNFIEEKLSNEEKEDIFNRVNSKINKRNNKKRSKSLLAAACGVVVAIMFTQTEVFAVLNETIGKNIESFFAEKDIKIESNTKDILQECESNGIKITLHQAVIEDDDLFVSATLDYSNFNNEDHYIEKNLYSEVKPYKYDKEGRSIANAFTFYITQNGENKEVTYSDVSNIYDEDKDNKKIEMLIAKKIINVDDNKNFEIKLEADELMVNLKRNKYSRSIIEKKAITGEWKFSFSINSKSSGVNNNKVYNINNEMEIPYKKNNLKFNLRNVKVSTFQIKIHYDVDFVTDGKYDGVTHYKVLDQDGRELRILGGGGDDANGIIYSYFHSEDLKTIKIVPYIQFNKSTIIGDFDKEVEFEDQAIEIDLNE